MTILLTEMRQNT